MLNHVKCLFLNSLLISVIGKINWKKGIISVRQVQLGLLHVFYNVSLVFIAYSFSFFFVAMHEAWFSRNISNAVFHARRSTHNLFILYNSIDFCTMRPENVSFEPFFSKIWSILWKQRGDLLPFFPHKIHS